jgi:isopentenyl phosphate kinase
LNSKPQRFPTTSKRRLIIVKLGGSVITDKTKPLTPRVQNIERLTEEIGIALKNRKVNLIIIHGGGSYGHPLAKKFGISDGLQKPSQLMGFVETHQSMLTLNEIVMKELLAHHLPVISFAPVGIWSTDKGRISEGNHHRIEEALQRGLIPVLFGDTIFDKTNGIGILSGDQIISYLTKRLQPDHIIIGTDVDGLYTADPKTNPNTQFIPVLSQKNAEKVISGLEGAKAVDVTGGMRAKVVELLEVAKNTKKIVILNANVPNRMRLALEEKPVHGTLISLK